MPQNRPRKPKRRDEDDLFEAFAAVFATLPPWAPLLALAVGNAGVYIAFDAFHWNVAFRPIVLLLVTCFFAFSGIAGLRERVARRKRLQAATSLDALRALSWREFEHLVLAAYAKQGWSASLTQVGADGGADIVLERQKKKVLVQCKQWRTRQIGAPTLRELHSVMVTEHATSGIVVTCGTFSSEALAIGKSVGIECVDGSDLLRLVGAATTAAAPGNAGSLAAAPPACPRCSSPMIQRRGNRGQFWGCSTYPRCRGTVNILTN